jgi:MFS-type transporter involved in bile tolerance (Atg22 family)
LNVAKVTSGWWVLLALPMLCIVLGICQSFLTQFYVSDPFHVDKFHDFHGSLEHANYWTRAFETYGNCL